MSDNSERKAWNALEYDPRQCEEYAQALEAVIDRLRELASEMGLTRSNEFMEQLSRLRCFVGFARAGTLNNPQSVQDVVDELSDWLDERREKRSRRGSN